MWHHVTKICDDMGVLTAADGIMLGRYCRIYQSWLETDNLVQEHGLTYVVKTTSGDKMVRTLPHAQLRTKLSDQMLRIEQEFGLSPSSRSSVRAIKPAKGKRKSRFFSKTADFKAG